MSERKVFRNAVELDEYLASLTPEEQKRMEMSSTSLTDQVHAARAEGVAAQEKQLGNPARWVPHNGSPDWLRLGQLDVILKWHQGKVLTCVHRPVPSRPEPVYAAAWLPGRVVCAKCIHMLCVDGEDDTVCDGCGHKCAGLPDDGIMPITSFIGSLGYRAGVCDSCHAELLRVEKEAKDS